MHVIIYPCPYTDAGLANIYISTLYRFYIQNIHMLTWNNACVAMALTQTTLRYHEYTKRTYEA